MSHPDALTHLFWDLKKVSASDCDLKSPVVLL